ncbi:MAG TPA: hypothetical protein PK999_19360, partial [Nitrospira sp.]|nr:hypothetical protein [Nitrospira sp.]
WKTRVFCSTIYRRTTLTCPYRSPLAPYISLRRNCLVYSLGDHRFRGALKRALGGLNHIPSLVQDLHAMPDFMLPVIAGARESLHWVETPAYNRAFVSGQDASVLGQVTRPSTAGDA